MAVSRRVRREKRTIRIMVGMHCRVRHGSGSLICGSCEELLTYATERIDKCPFIESKPQCNKCLVHCYKPAMRDRVRQVMRFAGPRMLWSHPYLALMHIFDGMLHKPRKKQKSIS